MVGPGRVELPTSRLSVSNYNCNTAPYILPHYTTSHSRTQVEQLQQIGAYLTHLCAQANIDHVWEVIITTYCMYQVSSDVGMRTISSSAK